jgi:hypothetical protein
MRSSSILVLTVLLFAPGRHAGAQRIGTPVIEKLPNGVVRTWNTGPSQWTGTAGWKLVLERTITADGTAGLIAEPRSLATDSHGNIFETDWKFDGIQVFDPSGTFLRQIGRKGDGPGEFKVPIEIAIRGDTLLAYASNQSRVSLWRADGKLIREWPVNFCCGGNPKFDQDGTVMVGVLVRSRGADRQAAIRWSANGIVRDTVMGPFQPSIHVWETSRGTFTIPFVAYQVGIFNSRDAYVSGRGDRYSLAVARNGSDTAQIIELPGIRAATSAAAIDSAMARFARIPQLAGIAKRSDIPAEQPFFRALHVDEDDNIWIERPGPDGRTASFDVVTVNGVFLGTIAVPPTQLQTLHLANGRLYASVEMPDGDRAIQVYRIDKRRK